MRTTWVVGNWKMNGDLASNAALLESVVKSIPLSDSAKVAVCVPFPYLAQVQSALSNSAVVLGAQDVSQFEEGAYTGEVSAKMLKEFGVSLVLVGHSERRSLFGETDVVVAKKAKAALDAGLMPVVCVGETLAEREAGQAQAVVLRQFSVVANEVGAEGLKQSILAYEPVWAIGTGKTATPEQAQEVHSWLREALLELGAESVSMLYGGSVKVANAAEIFSQADVDGGLIGGASLVASEFLSIAEAAR
ncbi:Triosephosphate isomerase [Ephemeroptericola cinctiostellae]|uniref:Triosephosphate isomerase n=1 Tax=Ephemeroptericola cinctiostellae TaxID=2268024 RepID=A0A345D7M8_9BURK|nr:triose-phosphate isomerase [Ephemeroptericola cinctiostellae]AXF84366.1 Triosephosphate isomerase [Ephemeroptericola cinctiostellae]